MKDKLKDVIRSIVECVGLLALGAFLGAVLIHLHDNSRILQILVSDWLRITAPLRIFQPVADFISWVILALVALIFVVGGIVWIAEQITAYKNRKRNAAKNKRNSEMVYRKGKWMTRSEAERQDKPPAPIKHSPRPSAKRSPVKRIYQSQHRSETAEAARQAFTPDEWRRLGDLRAAVIDGSMGVDEARRLLAGDGQQDKPPAPITPARPSAKREPVKDVSMGIDEARQLLFFMKHLRDQRPFARRKIVMELPLSKIVEWAENGSLDKGEAGLLLMIKEDWTAHRDYWLGNQGDVFWHEGLLPERPSVSNRTMLHLLGK